MEEIASAESEGADDGVFERSGRDEDVTMAV